MKEKKKGDGVAALPHGEALALWRGAAEIRRLLSVLRADAEAFVAGGAETVYDMACDAYASVFRTQATMEHMGALCTVIEGVRYGI